MPIIRTATEKWVKEQFAKGLRFEVSAPRRERGDWVHDYDWEEYQSARQSAEAIEISTASRRVNADANAGVNVEVEDGDGESRRRRR